MQENVAVDSNEEDSNYQPSGDDDSEDETMDTEADAHIWLEDVDQPTSSRRFKGRRWTLGLPCDLCRMLDVLIVYIG